MIDARCPVHVTLRVRRDVPNLRSRRGLALIEAALAGALRRPGFRIVHFDILGNHLHLIVEADSSTALAHGMQGFTISVAKRINAYFSRTGPVFSDRYHAHVLRTPAEVRHALAYVLLNHRSHEARMGVRVGRGALDPFSSAACFDGWSDAPRPPEPPRVTSPPRSWLLATGWRRRGLLSLSEIPALRE